MAKAETDLGRHPTWLEPLAEDRSRMERILDRLNDASDPIERADLASELVRSASRYEDTLERAVLARDPDQMRASALEPTRVRLREVMTVIHKRTSHLDPRNVYAPDPQGFEDALSEVRALLPKQLADEDRVLEDLARSLTDDEAAMMRGYVEHSYRHASERPQPPRTKIGRLISNANVKLDHAIEDVASPQHPGAETVRGTASD